MGNRIQLKRSDTTFVTTLVAFSVPMFKSCPTNPATIPAEPLINPSTLLFKIWIAAPIFEWDWQT